MNSMRSYLQIFAAPCTPHWQHSRCFGQLCAAKEPSSRCHKVLKYSGYNLIFYLKNKTWFNWFVYSCFSEGLWKRQFYSTWKTKHGLICLQLFFRATVEAAGLCDSCQKNRAPPFNDDNGYFSRAKSNCEGSNAKLLRSSLKVRADAWHVWLAVFSFFTPRKPSARMVGLKLLCTFCAKPNVL